VRTWSEVLHPRTGGGSWGQGHDPATTALLCTVVRDLLVREIDHRHLALCSVVPGEWFGQGWEVRDLPTAAGRLGYALRWHGDRPALLWELEPWERGGPVRLTAPGLDPGWSTDRSHGESLLAPCEAGPGTTTTERNVAGPGAPGASSSFG
jgi:hypothetical protein